MADHVEIHDATLTGGAAVTAAHAQKVDGSAVTQPVSAASLPLPSGAAIETGNLATVATLAGAVAGDDLLRSILIELRTITYYLQNGLNVDDEPSIIRNDPSILQ